MAQERPRGATPHLRSGQQFRVPGYHSARAAERSYPTSEARGGSWEEPPTPEARGGGREEQPHVQGVVAAWVQEGLEELFHIQGRRAGGEEIHLVQGKEQRLCFAGGAERYPTSEVREIQVIQ